MRRIAGAVIVLVALGAGYVCGAASVERESAYDACVRKLAASYPGEFKVIEVLCSSWRNVD